MLSTYFVQYSHQSIIDNFNFPEDLFVCIDIGMKRVTNDFIFSLTQKMFGFPIYFVLEPMIFEEGLNTLIHSGISSYKFSKEGYVTKISSKEQLELISVLSEELVVNGNSVHIFYGQGLSEENLIPTKNWSQPTEFNDLDNEKVETFVEITEVGLTIFTKNGL